MTVIFSASEWMNEPMPFVTVPSLALIERGEPAPAPASAWEAREAQRLMGLSTLFGAATPIARETDDRIILSEVDRLVQQMIGWRELDEVAPGLPVLVIPPRSEPEGWTTIKGVIQKKVPIALENNFWPQYHCAYFERVGVPDWLAEERERISRKADDAIFTGMINASDGRVS